MQAARPARASPYDVVAIAASAGGVPALLELLNGLPVGFPASVLVVLHRSSDTNHLPDLLNRRRMPLPVRTAEEGQHAAPGTIYMPPGGRHLLVGPDKRLSIARAGHVDYVCPSADLLFESVAREHAQRAVAIVLTGMGTDGARGVQSVRKRRGYVIAQDPASAAYPAMPYAAIETGKVDLILPLEQIPYALGVLTKLGAERNSQIAGFGEQQEKRPRAATAV